MLSKKIFKIVIIMVSIALALIIAVVGFYLWSNKNISSLLSSKVEKKVEIVSDDEKTSLNLFNLGVYEVLSRDEQGKITSYKFIKLRDPEPIATELMSDQEKTKFNIGANNKIQVLTRDSKGDVTSYKIIKDDSDIVKDY